MKDNETGKRIKALRNRKGFSQEDLAEESGLSLRTIQRIENGETAPLGDSLKRISSSLNVNPEELIDWTIKEDIGYLKTLNLSALTFIFFPILGILVPFIMWVSKKDKLKDINKIGREVVNFEITWTIILFIGLLINPIIQNTTGEVTMAMLIIPSLIFMAIMYTLNFIFIIFNTLQIHNEKDVKYYPKISFLKA